MLIAQHASGLQMHSPFQRHLKFLIDEHHVKHSDGLKVDWLCKTTNRGTYSTSFKVHKLPG